jgi:hypothetical protein
MTDWAVNPTVNVLEGDTRLEGIVVPHMKAEGGTEGLDSVYQNSCMQQEPFCHSYRNFTIAFRGIFRRERRTSAQHNCA